VAIAMPEEHIGEKAHEFDGTKGNPVAEPDGRVMGNAEFCFAVSRHAVLLF
jgi:hypothetical protein